VLRYAARSASEFLVTDTDDTGKHRPADTKHDILEAAYLLSPFVILAFCLPALAQTQFSAQITSNVNGASATLANPVYYNETITATTA
jgi:hypothetical protein